MVSRSWFVITVLCGCALFTGCQLGVSDVDVFDRYYQTTLRLSNSADVLAYIQKNRSEFLTPSESVVASWGETRKGSSLWFNVVAFDEEELTAVRKYCLTADEKTRSFYVKPMRKLRFNSQIVLSEEILEKPYADENTRRIAILQEILDRFGADVLELIRDSRTLRSGTIMAKQTLNTILTKLKQSPALARTLTRVEGMSFDHMILGPGSVRMIIGSGSDIVEVRIIIGKDKFYQPAIP